MTIDLPGARAFLATSARQLDRRRAEGSRPAILAALDAYRNDDGGDGWGREPDLRSPESQPTAAMHALEVLAEVGGDPEPVLDWLAGVSLDGGALPFTVPVTDPAGCAPWWLAGDHTTPSLQMTAQVLANAHLAGGAAHPWVVQAGTWCSGAIRRMGPGVQAYELLFALRYVDVAPDGDELLDAVRPLVPADGVVPVAGGAEGEAVHLLDLAPRPGRVRTLFADDEVARDRERLAARQQPDGGWTVDFPSSSPAAALEWRGYATVQAINVLR